MIERYTTPENINPPFEYDPNVDFEFIALSRELAQIDKTVKFGPIYRGMTSAGLKIEAHMFFVDDNLPANWVKNYFLIVEDEQGNVVAHRSAVLGQSLKDPNLLDVRGDIAVRAGGRGVASTTEQFFSRFLQEESDKRGEPIVWKIHNGNLTKLKNLKVKYDLEPSQDLAAQIKTTEEEQKRWQILYGSEKLGLTKISEMDFERTFIPQPALHKSEPRELTTREKFEEIKQKVSLIK